MAKAGRRQVGRAGDKPRVAVIVSRYNAAVTDRLCEGAVAVTVNDSTFVPHLGGMFDGDTAWPSRSDSVNPLVIDFAFQRPIRLAAARVFLVGSTYQWVAEARAGVRWSRQSAPGDEWSQIDLRPPVETTSVRLELLRLLRDDNVHVSEIELYTTTP